MQRPKQFLAIRRSEKVNKRRKSPTSARKDRGTFRCDRSRCNTCRHTNSSTFIDTPGGRLKFKARCTCVSKNVVYAIICSRCHMIYIGQTDRRLGDRFREHLLSTKVRGPNLPVGRHFASSGHTTENMRVSVIRAGLSDARDRRIFEAKMIIKHDTLHPNGLNMDI